MNISHFIVFLSQIMACIPEYNAEFPPQIISLQKNYSCLRLYSLSRYSAIFQLLYFKPHIIEEDTLLQK